MPSDADVNSHRHDLVDADLDGFSGGRASQRAVMRVVITVIASAIAFVSSVWVVRSPELAIAAYVLGLGLILIWIEPFLGLLNYLVFVYLRPQEFIGQFQGIPVMLLVGGATFGVTVVYYALRRKWLFKHPQDALVMWLFLALVVSHLAQLFIGGAIDAANYFANRVVLYLLIVGLIATRSKLRTVMYTLTLLTLYQAVQGIYQYRTGAGFAGQEMIEGRITGIGIFADPNNLAMTFLLVFPFVVNKLVAARSLLFKLAAVGVLAVLIYATFLTDSRGGFLGLGAVVLIMVARRVGFRKGAVVGLLFFALMFVLGPSRMRDFSTRESSAYGRVEAWAAGMDMIQGYPIFGVGARNFTDHHWLAAHNSFIQCFAEIGLFGVIPWMMLIIVCLRTTNYVSRRAPPQQFGDLALYADSIFNAMVAFLVTTFFISRAYNDLFFILVGLCTVVVALYVQESGQRFRIMERKDLIYAVVGTVVLTIVFKAYLILYW